MSKNYTELQHYQKNWQQQLADAITTLDELCGYLGLAVEDLPVSAAAAGNFPLRVPLNFAECMEKGNPDDPLLRQVLPVLDELAFYPGFSSDPVGDLQSASRPGILHKYHGRVLLINTGSCAINCRYCFRRNFPYSDYQLSKQRETEAIQYIREDASISEVILSGGDPLLLNDDRLEKLFRELSFIPHVKRVRIHSRLPIVLPDRISGALIGVFARSPRPVILVVHCNHPKEINDRVSAACLALKEAGVVMLNQSVLLRGVNDSAGVLCDLSEKLFSHGILPYYLHLLDKATGTGHFEVPKPEALALIEKVRNRLPGYLVPKLVLEQAGAPSKQPVA